MQRLTTVFTQAPRFRTVITARGRSTEVTPDQRSIAVMLVTTGLTGAPGSQGIAQISEDAGNALQVGSDNRLFVPAVAGPQGLSAYQVAVAAGFVGTQAQWVASLQGADGASAATMPDGTTTLTFASGRLTAVDYPDGSTAALTWSGAVLQSAATTRAGSTRTRTLTWSGGVLQSVNTVTTP